MPAPQQSAIDKQSRHCSEAYSNQPLICCFCFRLRLFTRPLPWTARDKQTSGRPSVSERLRPGCTSICCSRGGTAAAQRSVAHSATWAPFCRSLCALLCASGPRRLAHLLCALRAKCHDAQHVHVHGIKPKLLIATLCIVVRFTGACAM